MNRLNEVEDEKNYLNANQNKIDEENILDILINDNVNFGWEHTKMVFLLILYIIGEGFVMIGMSLLIPVVSMPWELTEFQKGFAGGSIFMGFTLGAISAGIVSDNKGRKTAFIIGNVFSIIGGIIGFLALGIKTLIISNFLIGFGLGISIPSIFSLCSEITNSKVRAFIMGTIWIFFVFGEIFGCMLAMTFEIYDYENYNWKKILIFRCLTFIISIPLVLTICESPKFLLTMGRDYEEKAFEIVYNLLGEDRKHMLTDELKNKISLQYKNYMLNSSIGRSSYSDLFNKQNLKTSLVLFALWYIVSYIYYGLIYILPNVYQQLKLSLHHRTKVNSKLYDEIISDVIFSCIFEIPSNIFCGIAPNLIGRKMTILLGFIGATIFSILCLTGDVSIPFYSSLLKASINIPFGVLFIYTAEIFPTYMRATGLGTCNSITRIGGFTTPFINEFLLNLKFLLPFISYAGVSFLGIILTMMLEETLGKSNY